MTSPTVVNGILRPADFAKDPTPKCWYCGTRRNWLWLYRDRLRAVKLIAHPTCALNHGLDTSCIVNDYPVRRPVTP